MEINMTCIDLHTHSIASDGALSPRGVVKAAKEAGLSAIALTDHDTVEGVEEALFAGEEFGVRVIPGVEMSADFKTEMHILGYHVNIRSAEFADYMKIMREFRRYRNEETARLLSEAGAPVTFEEAKSVAGGDTVGRVHFAMVMVEKGIVSSVKEGFQKWLSVGKPGYFQKQKFSPGDVIRIIKDAGGVAVLAHPKLLAIPIGEYDPLFADLKEMGLVGVECLYNSHTDEERDFFLALTRKHGLCPTGGSDFHGQNKPHVKIGKVYGDQDIPYSILEQLESYF